MNYIVATSINPPTEAIRKFDALPDWKLLVVGDLKTPLNYHLERGTYVCPQEQDKYDKELSKALGWNNVMRRNIGILMAYDLGAEVIALVDDDNIPYENWGKNLTLGKATMTHYYHTDLPAFDPVGAADQCLWHRGFPIQLLAQRDYNWGWKDITPTVQADFWDGDPDVDAICRMEYAPQCVFNHEDFPIAANKPSPFNSQNTFLLREVIPNYFLPPGIPRMEDIWASYYAQAKGARVIYCEASVYQSRNEHDLTKDLVQEFVGYEKTLRLINDLAESTGLYIKYEPDHGHAFNLYLRHF